MSAKRLLAHAALPLLLGACSWFTDFKQQPKYDPWESPSDTIAARGNPQQSVPVQGSFEPGFMVSRTALPTTIDSMSGIQNPVPADARSLENGRKLFQINCEPCHGNLGMGNGPATKYGMVGIGIGRGSNAANTYTDGYIWGMIRNGRGLMPTYNRIEEMERWDIVNYLRALQGKIPGVTVDTLPPGKPGETGNTLPSATELGPTRPAPYYKHIDSQAGIPMRPGVVPSAPRPDTARADSTRVSPARPDTARAPQTTNQGNQP